MVKISGDVHLNENIIINIVIIIIITSLLDGSILSSTLEFPYMQIYSQYHTHEKKDLATTTTTVNLCLNH